MSKNPAQKQRLLYLRKILLEKTDEEHGLTSTELIDELKVCGINVERKCLYDDLKALEDFGLDICRAKKGKTVEYYIGNRDFEVAELKLLVDAIQSSKFITEKKSLQLIEKLERLVSDNEGKLLQRQVYVANRGKNVNEKIYYNVDRLHTAISLEKQISFKYLKWSFDPDNEEKIVKTERRDGEIYRASPWALCWEDEYYYLIAFDKREQKIKHYRVDKMESIEITDETRDGREQFESFDIAGYSKQLFSMFGGETAQVTLSVKNELVGVIADRFGADVKVERESGDSFTVNVEVILSPQFYAWVFGLGTGIKISAPENVKRDYLKSINKISEIYS